MGIATPHMQRRQAGFTLMELLVVIAILGVILAITAPSLAPIARSMEMNRLDNYAKEIYVAIQDQFISMEASGEYQQFNKTVMQASSRNLGAMGVAPADASGNAWYNYYYLTNNPEGDTAAIAADQALSAVVARTAVVDGLTRGGRYILEINPRSDGTDVYSVFYSEDPNFSYADVEALASRDRDARMNTASGYPVGYYCGASANAAELPDHFSPRVTFVNGEELFLHITSAGGVGLVGNERNITVKIVFSDGANEETVSLQGGSDFSLSPSGNIDFDYVVDSMRPGMALADIFANFEPGADISATVDISYEGESETITTPSNARGQAKENSLYAKKTDDVVEVANVRHVHNLNLLEGASLVRQTSNIDFDASTWGNAERTQLSSATRTFNETQYGPEYVNPLDPRAHGEDVFAPIAVGNAQWTYDGQNNTLANFYIEGAGQVGLFDAISAQQTLRNTILVDPTIVGSGQVGALAGAVEGSVENCGVHLDITRADQTDKTQVYTVQAESGESAGGLVGSVAGSATISRSYAAIHVVAPNTSAVGGLAGQVSTAGTIQECYASGEIDGGPSVGGLIGVLDAGTVDTCYSTADVFSPGTAGGLVGTASGGQVANSAAYGRVSAGSGGGFVGSAAAACTNCAYLEQIGYNEGLVDQPAGVEAQNYATLATGSLAANKSFPYKESLMGKAFPFATTLEEHWGNWPASANINPLLVYYEYYAIGNDGYFGFYGSSQTEDGTITIDTIDAGNSAIYIPEDGYALISPYPIQSLDYSLNGQATQRLRLGNTAADDTYMQLDVDSIDYWDGTSMQTLDNIYVYRLPYVLQMPDRVVDGSFLDTLELTFGEVGGASTSTFTYYYNPDFAKCSASPDIEGNTDLPNTERLYVRTARHLNRLAYQSAYWSSAATIVQDFDIDFGYYETDYLGHTLDFYTGAQQNKPIGTMSSAFSGTFDGAGHVIIDYNQTVGNQQEAGLFGAVASGGQVINTHVASSALEGSVVLHSGQTGGATLAAGVLVGWLDGLVSDCSASGYQIYAGQANITDASVGGLVGVNQGTIQRSSAADVSVNVVSTAGSAATLGLGGLAGSNGGSIVSCYSVGCKLVGQAPSGASGSQLLQGGIAGYGYGGSIANCYGYAFAEDTIAPAGATVTHFDIADAAGNSINNCYRLNYDGFTTGATDGAEVTSCDYEGLCNAPIGGGFVTSADQFKMYGSAYFYDVRETPGHIPPSSQNYPYPCIYTDVGGEVIHYGFDWWW